MNSDDHAGAGPVMGGDNSTAERGTQTAPAALRVVKRGTGRELGLINGVGSARAIVWPGMGARYRTMHHLTLGPRASTVDQEHPGEAVYTVLDGTATVSDRAGGETETLIAGAMVHLEPHTRYSFDAGENGAVILGGPCPPDVDLYGSD